MSTELNKPSPRMMPPRINRVPPASTMPERRHAFSPDIPRRGLPQSVVFADAGVLLCVCGRQTCIVHFANHYSGRLRIADCVEDEIRRLASPSGGYTKDGRLYSTARTAQFHILDAGIGVIEPSEACDARIFDQVHRQLVELAERNGKDVAVGSHLGEAMSIALCVQRSREGNKVIFLTNDGDASLIAEAYEVPARHFGHVLTELVCAGKYQPSEAFEMFSYTQEFSGVPMGARPTEVADLACVSADAICLKCDALT
ncbi:hypothetical protein ACFP2T_37560 [Plantactinospora solaniradicis]|uniref:NYN domain-containing protein n=1 Tax=Plantactinospora solaniradicis TaxID=1723736 RepID=A0ABW1KJA1_9ACTN